jgi:hypothetical protein
MKKITKQQMIDFIMAQPDDRPINMRQNEFDVNKDDCGCLMVEFAKDYHNITEGRIYAGLELMGIKDNDRHINLSQLGFSIRDLVKNSFLNDSKNFGELKKSLKN